MDNVRSFIAIELPEETKSELARIQTAIRRQVASGAGGQRAGESAKWVDPTGMHLTLKFLGWVSPSNVPAIEEGIRRAVKKAKPFNLALKELGVFPGWSRPRVIWVGVEERGSAFLGPLQEAIEDEMDKLGFAREQRAFTPHLTLARVRETATAEERRAIGEAVRKTPAPRGMPFVVTEVSLMRSELSPRGARYSRLAAFPL